MVESSEPPTTFPDIARRASPLLFGPLFNWALYGALCVQICTRPILETPSQPTHPSSDVYSYNFPNDRRPVKFLAYFIFLLETVQTALTGADVYYWLIVGFGDLERLTQYHFGGIDTGFMTALISLIVQGYFSYRIWVLNNKKLPWICWIIAVFALTQSAAMTWLSIESRIDQVGKFGVSKTAVYLWSIPSALVDILIAVAMTLLLRRASGNFTSFVLIRMVRLTIETNALTAISAITILVLYAAFPNEVYYMYLVMIIGKLYSNTLLVSLNNRIYFREHQPPGNGDCTCLAVSDRVRAPEMSSLNFVVPEPQTQASKDVIFPLDSISQPRNLARSSTDLSPPHPSISCALPGDLELAARKSPHSGCCGLKDEIGQEIGS
ncbi:hypothetical protein V8E53_014193 [Lactarius tabidus]